MLEIYVGDLLQETAKAYGFDGGKIVNSEHSPESSIIYVPKSQVEYDAAKSVLCLPVWLAIEKNYMQSQ